MWNQSDCQSLHENFPHNQESNLNQKQILTISIHALDPDLTRVFYQMKFIPQKSKTHLTEDHLQGVQKEVEA